MLVSEMGEATGADLGDFGTGIGLGGSSPQNSHRVGCKTDQLQEYQQSAITKLTF